MTFEKLIRYFSQDQVLRFQLLTALLTARLFISAKKFHEANCRKFNDSILYRRRQSKASRGSEKTGHSWHEFPEMPVFWRRYEVFSNLVMFYSLLKQIFPFERLVALIVKNPKRPYHCYIPGKFVYNFDTYRSACIAIVAAHLVWRFTKKFLTRHSAPNLVLFLMQDKRVLDRYYHLIANSHLQSILATQSLGGLASGPEPCGAQILSARDQFLRSLIAYPVRYKSRTIYRTRPNRTLQARNILKQVGARIFFYTNITFACNFVYITIYIVYYTLVNSFYQRLNTGCDPYLELQLAVGIFDPGAFTMTREKLLFALMSSLESVPIYLDTGFAISQVMAYGVYIYCDLANYWKIIDENIRQLAERQRVEWAKASVNIDTKINCYNLETEEMAYWFPDSSVDRESIYARPEESLRMSLLETEVHELQCLMDDFFKLFEESDYIVSDILTMGALIWLLSVTFETYNEVLREPGDMAGLAFHMVQAAPFFTLIITALVVTQINNQILGSYCSLCSLIAYDRSRFKRKFTAILGYYSDRRRYCWTLFRSYPLTQTSLLTMIGWTITVGLFVYNLYKNYSRTPPDSEHLNNVWRY